MTEDQSIRLQCIEMAVKAGAPYSLLTQVADSLVVYVRGLRTQAAKDLPNMPVGVFDAPGGGSGAPLNQMSRAQVLEAYGRAEDGQELAFMYSPELNQDAQLKALAAAADRGTLMSNLDYGKSKTLANALLATLPEDQRGTPVEETDDDAEPESAPKSGVFPTLEAALASAPGVAVDPRLPKVSM